MDAMIAPEARTKVAHGETVGLTVKMFKSSVGATGKQPISVAPLGLDLYYFQNPRLNALGYFLTPLHG